MLLVKLDQPVLEFGKREKVAGLAPLDGGCLMDGTFAGFELFFCLERLTPVTVPALVVALVYVAVVVNLLYELAATLVVPRLAGLDEIVVADFQGAPNLLKLPGHVVAVFLGGEFQLRGPLGHLDGVLVVAHEEMDVVPLHAPVAGLNVGA